MRRDDAVRVRGAAAVDPGEGEVRLSARVVHLHLDTLRALRVGGGARESHRTQLARRPVGGGPGREGGVPPAPQGANERESVRVITRKAPRARSGQPVGVVHKLAVAAPVPHRQLRKVLLRRRRGVRARAIRPPPQPLAPRALPAGRDCGPRRRGQAVVHHRVRELVREDAPPAVARVRLGSEQVLLAARGLQPAHASRSLVEGHLRGGEKPPPPPLELGGQRRAVSPHRLGEQLRLLVLRHLARQGSAHAAEVPVLGEVGGNLARADEVKRRSSPAELLDHSRRQAAQLTRHAVGCDEERAVRHDRVRADGQVVGDGLGEESGAEAAA
mmetsp:Transcript_29053/g.93106  ORF Transcript_29053/g.93106 Transcript_29053/m.93106 type:complete len:329 (-) Transcript_29053:367-1353(-)